MRGQGLDCKSGEGGVTSPLAAAADVTARFAFIVNKLHEDRGLAVDVPPHRRLWCLLFIGYSYLPNTRLYYVTQLTDPAGILECVSVLPGAVSS